MLKEPMFDWKLLDRYIELCYFEIEIKDLFLTNNYSIQEREKLPIIMNWLGNEGLNFMQIRSDTQKGKCRAI